MEEKFISVNISDVVKRYEMSGGNIINVVHYAGIKAVEKINSDEEQQRMIYDNLAEDENEKKLIFYLSDVINGIKRELTKEGKPFA